MANSAKLEDYITQLKELSEKVELTKSIINTPFTDATTLKQSLDKTKAQIPKLAEVLRYHVNKLSVTARGAPAGIPDTCDELKVHIDTLGASVRVVMFSGNTNGAFQRHLGKVLERVLNSLQSYLGQLQNGENNPKDVGCVWKALEELARTPLGAKAAAAHNMLASLKMVKDARKEMCSLVEEAEICEDGSRNDVDDTKSDGPLDPLDKLSMNADFTSNEHDKLKQFVELIKVAYSVMENVYLFVGKSFVEQADSMQWLEQIHEVVADIPTFIDDAGCEVYPPQHSPTIQARIEALIAQITAVLQIGSESKEWNEQKVIRKMKAVEKRDWIDNIRARMEGINAAFQPAPPDPTKATDG